MKLPGINIRIRENPYVIYARDEGNNTYSLVNKDGHSVNSNGTLAYSPRLFEGKAEDSGYPVWKGA